MSKAAVDTNILAYAEAVNDPARQARAGEIIESLGPLAIAPEIVFAELFYVLSTKGRRTQAEARDIVLRWLGIVRAIPLSAQWLVGALDLAGTHRLGIWDAAILDATAEAGCEVLLTEDLQHGFRWRGVTVVNPFAHPEHPLLARFKISP